MKEGKKKRLTLSFSPSLVAPIDIVPRSVSQPDFADGPSVAIPPFQVTADRDQRVADTIAPIKIRAIYPGIDGIHGGLASLRLPQCQRAPITQPSLSVRSGRRVRSLATVQCSGIPPTQGNGTSSTPRISHRASYWSLLHIHGALASFYRAPNNSSVIACSTCPLFTSFPHSILPSFNPSLIPLEARFAAVWKDIYHLTRGEPSLDPLPEPDVEQVPVDCQERVA